MSPDSDRFRVRNTIELARESDFAIGSMTVKPSASEVEAGGAAHKLEPRVMQVLIALARAEGAVVSRNDLIEICWGGVIVGEDAINRVVSRVRRLAELAAPPAFRVDTIPKVGYRLIAAAPELLSEPRREGPSTPIGSPTAPGRARPARLIAAIGATAILAIAGIILAPRLLPHGPTQKTLAAGAPPDAQRGEIVVKAAPPRLAILPFDVENAAEDQAYLAEGIAEEIYNRLAHAENIEVVGLSSAIAVHGVTDDVQELGKRLGARFILQGGLQRDGDNLRLSFELIDARDGAQIWFDSFDGAVRDVSRIEEEVERGIAVVLHIAVPASLTEPDISAQNPNAYELYLRGLAAFRRLQTRGDDGAISLLARAVELDPTINAARARLALSYAMHANNVVRAEGNFAAHARTLKLSRDTALAALAIEPENAVALTTLGAVSMQEKRYNEAHALFNFVRDIAPEEEAATLNLGFQLASAGYIEEAQTLLADAMDIHPASARIVGYLADYEMRLGDYESALEDAKLAYSLNFPPARWFYVVSLAAVGRVGDAADLIAADLAAIPAGDDRDWHENFWRMTLGAFQDDAGRERYVASIRERLNRQDPELVYAGAPEILNLLGEADLRDRMLAYMIDTGYFDRVPLSAPGLWAPWASNIRSSPQFKDLVTRMRFVPYWKEHGWPKGCWPKGADDFECG